VMNVDNRTVQGFGEEWDAYRQDNPSTLEPAFNQYFSIFPWHVINNNSEGFDMGCGSGRWARFVAPRVGKLNCIDPSEKALTVAMSNLLEFDNCTFEQSIAEHCSLKDSSQDFGYCLGVLHHIPDTLCAMRACAKKLKPGAPFLVYLYYRFDNKPFAFKAVWFATDVARRFICRLPFRLKLFLTQIIAATIYYPLARFTLFLQAIGLNVSNLPLSDYKNKTFNFMLTDALDRFGTRLEHRFTKNEIRGMMKSSGLESIRFSDSTPYWVAVGFKQQQ
jgi:SAM-dependent methyltransferase